MAISRYGDLLGEVAEKMEAREEALKADNELASLKEACWKKTSVKS